MCVLYIYIYVYISSYACLDDVSVCVPHPTPPHAPSTSRSVNMPEWGPSVQSNQTGGNNHKPKRQWGASIRFNLVVGAAAAAAAVVLARKQLRINWYTHQANFVDQSSLRKFATPVASWIAYGPEGWIPTVEEFQLMTKFMNKMDGGLLPSRLSDVLCEMKQRLLSLPRPADEAWNAAEKRLRKTYRQLLRRCNETAADAAVVAADVDVVNADEQEEALQVREAEDAGSACTSAQSDQHLMLFRKMNEWVFLDSAQKLERLQQAEEASRGSRRSLSQEELVDILNMAAACLADPRRHARLQDADSDAATDIGEVRPVPESQDPTLNLQKRIRSLFLQALYVWQKNQFDCQAIEHVLDFVHRKIITFEKKAGEIQCAAAAKAWLRIKEMVDELLPRIESQSSSCAHGTEAQTQDAQHLERKVSVRQDRQSGIQNISWRADTSSWRCVYYTSSAREKQTSSQFPIAKFLEHGLCEQEAVEAALQEAKAYREELVRQRKLDPPKPKPPSSTVMGVSFDISKKKWKVRSYNAVEKKTLHVGVFDTKEEAEAKAVEVGRRPEVRPDYEARPTKRRRAEVESKTFDAACQLQVRVKPH